VKQCSALKRAIYLLQKIKLPRAEKQSGICPRLLFAISHQLNTRLALSWSHAKQPNLHPIKVSCGDHCRDHNAPMLACNHEPNIESCHYRSTNEYHARVTALSPARLPFPQITLTCCVFVRQFFRAPSWHRFEGSFAGRSSAAPSPGATRPLSQSPCG
jgi:hypothetical protein